MSQPPGGGGGDVFGADHQKDDQSNNKRVVFVALKPGNPEDEKSSSSSSSLNPRTRRKRALGVDPTTTSFSEFEKQVANRLQLKFGIKAIRHKGSGMVVTSVEDLLDIEDLEVEEIREEEANANGGYGSTGTTTTTKRDESNNKASTSSTSSSVVNTTKDGDDDAEKYKRRTSMATRQLQKVLPYAYSKKLNPAGLDDSYEDEETLLAAAGEKKRKKFSSGSKNSGKKSSWFGDPRAIVVTVSLISCLLTMVLLYQRVSMLESEIDSARNAGILKTDGGNGMKKQSRTRMALEKIEKAAMEAEEAGEMYVPEA